MADLILATDTLNQGKDKINAIIGLANEAVADVDAALLTIGGAIVDAQAALDNSTATQEQLDAIILASGTSDAETVQARGEFPLLYNRLDNVDTQLAERAKYFDTVANMVNDSKLAVGEFVITLGYHNINDGGGAEYLIVDTLDSADGGILINTANAKAKILGDVINTRQLGLVENSQCQEKINNAIWRTETRHVIITDNLRVVKNGTGVSDIAQILPKSNFTLEFIGGASLTLDTPNEDYYRIISIEENRGRVWNDVITYHKENITIIKPKLYGDRDTTSITVGEYGHGLYIYGEVENITVIDSECYDMFGDGYGVGGGTNINFLGRTYAENCRRQGMSVIKVNGMELEYLHAKKIDGVAPFSAIDFEPNADGNDILGVHVGKIFAENVYRALLVVGSANKQITVDEIITNQIERTAVGYGEVEIYGNDKYVDVKIGRVISKNATDKSILLFRNTNEKTNIEIGSVRIENYHKTTGASVYGSATVLHEFVDVNYAQAGRIIVRQFSMINPVNDSTKFDYYLRIAGTATIPTLFKDVYLPIENPLTANIESNIGGIIMKNSLIGKPNFSNNTFHYFASDVISFEPRVGNRYVCSPFDTIKIDNPKLNQFYLGYKWFTDYALDKTYASVVVDTANKLYNITNFNGMIVMNHTAKTVSFKKILFDTTY